MTTADPSTNADANATNKNATTTFNARKRQRVVQLTVLSLSDIRVRVPSSPHSSVEQLTVGEGGAYHSCKEKLPAVTASHNVGSSIQPFLDKVGLGLNGSVGASNAASLGELQQSQINANQRGNLSLSAAVSFSGSCPPQHMHVLSPALCSKTGRMIVESDPVLRHGEDVADHSIHSATHEADGTIAHVLVAKWDGADADADDSITGDGQRNDISDNETAGTGGTASIESSKSEHWRRRREATFRRMGSGSNISQPHVTVKLHHRPTTASDDSNSDRGSMSPLKLPPFHTCNDRATNREECQQQQQLRGEEEDQKATSPEGKNEDDANIFRIADGASVPTVLRVPSPLPSPTRGSRPTSPALSDFGTSTKAALPVSANLPDIIELNVELIVGRDLASNVDGDSGGILQPHDNSGSLQPIGGIAHLKLFPKDAPEGGSSILELPVRKMPQSAAGIAAPTASKNKHPLVELGDNALLRVRIEIDSSISDLASRDDDDDDPSAIQWTLSGASAAVRAGAEEANGEEVSMAKLADDDDATASDLLASDGATRRRGMGARRVPGAFCSGLSDISEMWEAFTKKVVLNCVDHCDDDALVYVNEDGGDSLGSTINTVYENIMY